MKKQPTKPTPSFDSERETRVLLEEVRTELKVVAEGHGSIVKRLDNVEGELQEVKGRLGRVEGKLDQLQDQVGSVLTDHESRLKTLETK